MRTQPRFDDDKKRCGNCKYHQHEDWSDGWICVNTDSDAVADWTPYDYWCDLWEER